MKSIKDHPRQRRAKDLLSSGGFTLLEILIALTVIAILMSVSVPSYEAYRQRANKAVCISHMRNLHSALDSYIMDNNHWPQIPEGIFVASDESVFWEWWIRTLEPYGGIDTFWLCPADKIRKESPDEYNGSYLPTKFDAHQFTPYRWGGQPWLIERGNLHKKGAHIMFPDGSVRNSSEVY